MNQNIFDSPQISTFILTKFDTIFTSIIIKHNKKC